VRTVDAGSITSLGERSRGRIWAITYFWFVLGALVGGLALAMLLIFLREFGARLPLTVLLPAAFAAVAAVALASNTGRTPPSLERQVDHPVA